MNRTLHLYLSYCVTTRVIPKSYHKARSYSTIKNFINSQNKPVIDLCIFTILHKELSQQHIEPVCALWWMMYHVIIGLFADIRCWKLCCRSRSTWRWIRWQSRRNVPLPWLFREQEKTPCSRGLHTFRTFLTSSMRRYRKANTITISTESWPSMKPRMNDVELLYMHVWSFSSCTMSARPLSDSIVGLGEERPDSIDLTTVAELVSCPNRVFFMLLKCLVHLYILGWWLTYTNKRVSSSLLFEMISRRW